MTRHRDAYRDVGAATRAAVDAAMPHASKSDLRVLLAVVSYLTTYSKMSDTISSRQLQEATGLDKRAVSRALHSLANHGAIIYTPGASPAGGRRRAATIELPTPDRGSKQPPVNTTAGCHDRRSKHTTTGGQNTPRQGVTYTPIREGSEKTPEEGAATTLAKTLVTTHHDELPTLLEQLRTAHNPDTIHQALTDLTQAGARYRWPSELRNAITTRLRTTTPEPAQSKNAAILAAAPRCPTCHGDRHIEDTNGIAHRCPDCTQAMTA